MARIKTVSGVAPASSAGAFEMDKNAATIVGYGAMGAGSLLAVGVGTAVAPAPTLGLMTIGGGLAIAGNWHDVKNYFTKDGSKSPAAIDNANDTQHDGTPITVSQPSA